MKSEPVINRRRFYLCVGLSWVTSAAIGAAFGWRGVLGFAAITTVAAVKATLDQEDE